MNAILPRPRSQAEENRAHDVRKFLRSDRPAALAQARAWIARAAEHREAGRPGKAARALWWAAQERDIARRYRLAAAFRASGTGLFESLKAAGLHSAAG